jgi:hypothetical protein
VQAADRSGRYEVGVQGYWESPGVPRARVIMWRDGVPRLGPEADPYGGFTAVSTTGIAVGWATEDGQQQAVVYAYGQIRRLATPAGSEGTTAAAVNARGDVAGTTYGAGSPRAVVWSADGEVRVLATPAGFTHATATHGDEDGTVLGYAATGDPGMPDRTRLVVWAPGGSPRLLPATRPGDPEPQMGPADFRDGIVYGYQDDELVRWDLDAQTAAVVDTGGPASVRAVNARGSILADGGFGQDQTVLVRDGVVRPLHNGDVWITPVGLADNDVVFGRSNMNASPAYVDCR